MGFSANYFIGSDSSLWRTDVPVSAAVVFSDAYPAIDIKFYGNGENLEYDFVANPGSDPSKIAIKIEGATEVIVGQNGELVIATPLGMAVHKQPVAFQHVGAATKPVASTYVQLSDSRVGVAITGQYDKTLPLVIDPQIVFSTYLGGSSYDEGWGVCVDKDGNIYSTGLTASTDFPTIPPTAPAAYPVNVFVTKISPDGKELLYSTYIGGDGYDGATNLAVAQDGSIYLTGETKSPDFPLVNPVQSTFGGYSDAFVVKLSPQGNALLYSTYLGGDFFELGRSVAVTTLGEAVVGGHTCSPDFPIANGQQTQYGGDGYYCGDAFVAKLSVDGGQLLFSTFLGGGGYDEGWGLDVDDQNYVYVVGLTASNDFPVQSPLFAASRLVDAFLTKLTPDGSSLVYSTYFGGDDYDGATSVAVDRLHRASVAGETKSSDFPKMNPTQAEPGGFSDAFVIKFESDLSKLIFGTNIGGAGYELAWDVAVDDFGGVTIAGVTTSGNYPLQSPLKDSLTGSYDAIVSRVAPAGGMLTFSSYYGGSSEDDSRSVAVHSSKSVILSGSTVSGDFPVVNAVQNNYGGGLGPFPRGDSWVASLEITYPCGDLDGSGSVTISDALMLLNYIFEGGPAPIDDAGGDVNCNGRTNIADVVYLISYIFSGGLTPCAGCR